MSDSKSLIFPDWSAPKGVAAAVTTRLGGVSAAPFDGLNMSQRCGDDPAAVENNRQRVRRWLSLPENPRWLNQVHGVTVVAAHQIAGGEPDADAAWTDRADVVCAVLAADCLPVLLCNERARCVAAVHAGWRGLSQGVIEAAVQALPGSTADLMAWLGPAIGPEHFEVGAEVLEAFTRCHGSEPEFTAVSNRPGKYRANLWGLARRRLRNLGVTRIYGGGLCTYGDPRHFYSYRRDASSGRMAALIWMTDV